MHCWAFKRTKAILQTISFGKEMLQQRCIWNNGTNFSEGGFHTMMEVGEAAPEFTLESTEGGRVSLSNFKGKNIVLYFYPKDMTPGCTTEACDFRDQNDLFGKLNTVVVGISPDPVEKHRKFMEKHDLPFTLLADTDHKVAALFGAWQKKKTFGREYMGIVRSTFLIDKEGQVAKVWPKVKVKGHVEEVYQYVKNHLA